MAQDEVFEKLNDYTLSARIDFEHNKQADPCLRRIFNFKARQVTEIYSMWYSTGIGTQMQTQRFSDLDSLDEVFDMHARLKIMGGNPPPVEAPRGLPGKPGLNP